MNNNAAEIATLRNMLETCRAELAAIPAGTRRDHFESLGRIEDMLISELVATLNGVNA